MKEIKNDMDVKFETLTYEDLPKENSPRWLDRTPLSGEIWRPIQGYEGLYEVSSYGRVYSLERYVKSKRGWSKKIKPRIMKCVPTTYDYFSVSLKKDSNTYFANIHVLVGRAFIHNPYNLPQINHKDENKHNNIVNNLEWCDCEYNNNYGTRMQRIRDSQMNDKQKSKPVLQYSEDNVFIKEYPSISEANRVTGISECGIAGVCKKKKNHFTAGNYKWKFKDDQTPISDFPKPKLIIKVKAVHQFTKDGKYVSSFKSAKAAYHATGVWSGSILRCAKGERYTKSAGGYIWKFAT